MEPRVSVLLPVRDAAATLPACLDSLLGQTLADFEVVAVDDGSSDASSGLLARAAAGDPRLRVQRRAHRGLVAALNAGLAVARAPLLARMDADDVAHPERLEQQVRRFDACPTLDVLGTCVALRRDEPGGEGMQAYVAWSNGLLDHDAIVRDLFVEAPLVHPSVMLRREALTAVGGYRDFPGPEDYDLWLRGWRAGWRFAKTPATLLEWRESPHRLTRRDPRYAAERFLALKADVLCATHLAPERPAVIWGAGRIGKAWARALGARQRHVAAFVEVDRRKIGQRPYGVACLGVDDALPRGALHLAAVGQPGARQRIREVAGARGLREPDDLVAVA